LKKRTKKLFILCAVPEQSGRAQRGKSLFASFSSEKEDSCLIGTIESHFACQGSRNLFFMSFAAAAT
jgi:hypothetical protein